MKVLMIGVDGGDWRNIDYGIKKGKLPTIKKLIEKGCSGKLRSIIPPITFPAWLCLCSGKNPGKIGHYGYVEKIKGSTKTKIETESYFSEITPFWKILNENKIKVGIVNIPNTYPPVKTDEFMVCATEAYHLPKGADICFPKQLEEEITEKLDELEYEPNYPYFNKPVDEQLKCSINYLKNRSKLNKFLLQKYGKKLNLFFTVFFADRLQHFIIDKEKLMGYYIELDKEIKQLIGLYKPDYTFIFSDHGGGKVKKEFYVNEFLIKNGFLKLNRKEKFLSKIGINRENIQKFFSMLKLDDKIIKIFPRSFLENHFKVVVPTKRKLIQDADIKWDKTMACSLSSSGGIFINLKGREPKGIIDKKDYDKTIEKIIYKLKNLRDPETNKKINIEVYRKEEIYKGKYVDEAPDIIYALENWDYVPKISLPGKVFMEPRDPGNHKLYGIIIATGKNIKKGRIENGELIDITPTIFKLFNIKAPKDMDGKVLNIFK